MRAEQLCVEPVVRGDDDEPRRRAHERGRLFAPRLVQPVERLVQQQHVAGKGQRARDGHAAAHPARERGGPQRQRAAKIQPLKQLLCARLVRHERHVLQRRAPRQQPVLLEHKPDPPPRKARHRARVRPEQPRQHAQQRRLARAGRAAQRDRSLVRQAGGKVGERRARAKAHRNAGELDHGRILRIRRTSARSSSMDSTMTHSVQANRSAVSSVTFERYR